MCVTLIYQNVNYFSCDNCTFTGDDGIELPITDWTTQTLGVRAIARDDPENLHRHHCTSHADRFLNSLFTYLITFFHSALLSLFFMIQFTWLHFQNPTNPSSHPMNLQGLLLNDSHSIPFRFFVKNWKHSRSDVCQTNLTNHNMESYITQTMSEICSASVKLSYSIAPKFPNISCKIETWIRNPLHSYDLQWCWFQFGLRATTRL